MKKYTVKNYKGNLLESAKKFLDVHKGMKIVEAFEDNETLNIVADQLPQTSVDAQNTSEPASDQEGTTLMNFGSKLLLFGVEVHMWHLNCYRNSQHLALKELYEACDDIGDRLLEGEIGATGAQAKISFFDIDSTFNETSIDKIAAIKTEAAGLVGQFGAGPDNILGEFCEICESVLYKLKKLS